MKSAQILDVANKLVCTGKGLLAMDESTPTCNSRFAKLGISQTEETRRSYRELLVTTPRLGDYISGAILYDETIHQSKNDGTTFVQVLKRSNIIPGIKVDAGTNNFAGHTGEKVTEGLDRLRVRLERYSKIGAQFAKWRAVIAIGKEIPSRACLETNAHFLARYAGLCQEVGLVPIVEAEVLMKGDHTLDKCREVTETFLRTVFNQLYIQNVVLEGLILKTNMVLPGLACPNQSIVEDVADVTVKCLMRTVPAAVPGIAFLSGGQVSRLASARLNAMNIGDGPRHPWALTFSFSRALQQPVLDIWKGDQNNVIAAQKALLHRAKCNWAACRGEYSSSMEIEFQKKLLLNAVHDIGTQDIKIKNLKMEIQK